MVKAFTHFFIFLIVCLSIGVRTWAQTGAVSGKITDDKGTPISFATVVLQGTQLGTDTKEDGSFEITNVPDGSYNLKVTSLGYDDINQPVTVNVAAGSLNLSVSL